MKAVVLAAQAYRDLQRLEDWLVERGAGAALRFGDETADAIRSLAEFAERGRLLHGKVLRELVVRFGSAAYLIRYRVYEDRVVVVRIIHSRERR